jgi:hypothetical protein
MVVIRFKLIALSDLELRDPTLAVRESAGVGSARSRGTADVHSRTTADRVRAGGRYRRYDFRGTDGSYGVQLAISAALGHRMPMRNALFILAVSIVVGLVIGYVVVELDPFDYAP